MIEDSHVFACIFLLIRYNRQFDKGKITGIIANLISFIPEQLEKQDARTSYPCEKFEIHVL